MKHLKNLFILYLSFFCVLSQQVFTMEVDSPAVPADAERKIHIINSSEYPVRIFVGDHYPSSIALVPGHELVFPLKNVPTIKASTYGRAADYVTVTLVAVLDIAGFLQDRQDIQSQDLVANITYEKMSSGIWWNIAKYFKLCSKDKWVLALGPYDCSQDQFAQDRGAQVPDALYEKIFQSSKSKSEASVRGATLIWSMFPRAAQKIMDGEKAYPYNTLGLDKGGYNASEEQLSNWTDYLYKSLKKRFSFIENGEIWNMVDKVITRAENDLREGKFYAPQDPSYPVRLLNKKKATHANETPVFAAGLLDQLRERIGEDDPLVGQFERAALERCLVQPPRVPTPPPLPPPVDGAIKSLYREDQVARFLQKLATTPLEAQSLFELVVSGVFEKIDGLNIAPNVATLLKYAVWDKLRFVEQHKQNITLLNQVNKFMTSNMIRVAHTDANPVDTMQAWISFLAPLDQSRAAAEEHQHRLYQYAQLDEAALRACFEADNKRRGHEMQLMEDVFAKVQQRRASIEPCSVDDEFF